MTINAIPFHLFSTTTIQISLPATVTVGGRQLAMAAAPLVIGFGAWAATVMGAAMVFQDYRLRKRALGASVLAVEPPIEEDKTLEAGGELMAASNGRRPFSSSAQISVVGKSS